MDRRDIYEHLANIYLGASSRRKKNIKGYPQFFKNAFFISTIFISSLIAFLFVSLNKTSSFNSGGEFLLRPGITKINFNLNPTEKDVYSMNLNRLDLSAFKTLGFFVKKANYKDSVSLRIEFISRLKEKSVVYLQDIPYKWQDYKINLSEFQGINDWSNMLNLSFVVKDRNEKNKRVAVYLNNLRLLR